MQLSPARSARLKLQFLPLADQYPFLLPIDLLRGGTDLSRTVMTFLDFPLSLEQSITRARRSKPLRQNILAPLTFSPPGFMQHRGQKGEGEEMDKAGSDANNGGGQDP